MSTTHEIPVVATEAVAPSSTVEATGPTSTIEPTVESTQPAVATETAATEPALTEAAPASEPAKDGELVKVEAAPISSGNLGFKTGPLKLFKYSQRYFWLGDEAPLEESTISHFHKGNHENKHHTAAHATQTGKGLLLYAKRAEDKTQPEGIFNLADVTDVLKEGQLDFSFKVNDKKESFKATKAAERDSWIVAINNAVAEAATSKDTIRNSEGYKNSYKKYLGAGGLAAAGAGAGAIASKHDKTEDKVHDGAVAPTTTAAKSEPAITKKENSRSRSRGPLGLFKQTKEKTEANIEQAKEKKEIKKEEKAVAKEEKKEEKVEDKKGEDAALLGAGAATTGTAGVIAAHEKDTAETKTPVAQKRSSRFGSVGNIFGSKKGVDTKPTTEPISAEAPKVDSPVESGAPLTESVPTESATTTTAPAVETTPVTTEPIAATTAATPATTVEPMKTKEKSPSRGIKGFFAKKEAQAEQKSEEKKVEKEEKKAVKEEEKVGGSTSEAAPIAGVTGSTPFAASAAPTETRTITSVPYPAAEAVPETAAAAPVVAPAAETTITDVAPTKKEERRRSIFDNFKSKPKPASETKETAVEPVSTAGVEEPKDKKLFNLFRSSSKKVTNGPASTADAPPVPAKDTAVPATTETPLASETKAETPVATEAKPEISSVTADPPAEVNTTTTATGQPIAV